MYSMASPVEASAAAFQRLGASMQKFAITHWFVLGIGVLIGIVLQVILFGLFLSKGLLDNVISLTDPITWISFFSGAIASVISSLLPTMVIILIAALLLGLGLLIFVLLRYSQYLASLREASHSLNHPDLRVAYQHERRTFLLGFLLPFFSLLLVGVWIIPGIIALINPAPGELPLVEAFAVFFLLNFLVIGLGIALIVCQILAVIAIARWSSALSVLYPDHPSLIAMAEGAAFMKWGRILQVVLGVIGTLLYSYGLYKSGKALIRLAGPPLFGSPASGSICCPSCGTPAPSLGGRFCAQCGQNLPPG